MGRPRSFDFQAVLDRAVDSFWQQGYEGAPIQELCRTMGLKPGSVYGAYGDKRALFLAAFDRYTSTVSKDAIDRINSGASGLAGIRSYFDHLVEGMVDGKRRWGCLIVNSAVELGVRDGEIAERVRRHFAWLEGAFERALARAHAAGEVSDAGAQAAPFLVSVVQGLHVTAKVNPARDRLELIVRTALHALGCCMVDRDDAGMTLPWQTGASGTFNEPSGGKGIEPGKRLPAQRT